MTAQASAPSLLEVDDGVLAVKTAHEVKSCSLDLDPEDGEDYVQEDLSEGRRDAGMMSAVRFSDQGRLLRPGFGFFLSETTLDVLAEKVLRDMAIERGFDEAQGDLLGEWLARRARVLYQFRRQRYVECCHSPQKVVEKDLNTFSNFSTFKELCSFELLSEGCTIIGTFLYKVNHSCG